MAHEMLPSMGSSFDFHFISMAAVRGFWLLPFILMTGIVGFRLFVLNSTKASLEETYWEKSIKLKIRDFSRRWISIFLIWFAMMSLLALFHETMMITGKAFWNVSPYLLTVLEKTHWGRAWIDRALLLILLGMFWGSCLKKEEFPYRWFLVILVLISATFSLIGHPADKGDYRWSIPMDAIHLMAVSLWIGGLLPLFYLLLALKADYHPEMNRFITGVVERFSSMAMAAVLMVAGTGLYSVRNSWGKFPSWDLVSDSNYGNILTVKVIFVMGVLACGGLSRFYILPGLRKAFPQEGLNLLNRFFVFLLIELILAAIVLFLAFFLTQSTPPLIPSSHS
jgi:putative copper resistance protein D